MISLLVPALATCWLVRELVSEEEQQRAVAIRGPLASKPVGVVEVGSAGEPAPPVPDELQIVRLAHGPALDQAKAREIVGDPTSSTGTRYVALRRLESLSGPAAVEEAEAIVVGAADDPEGRFLAANALAVLARAPTGRDALARCVERASTDSLRRAARTLLERRAR